MNIFEQPFIKKQITNQKKQEKGFVKNSLNILDEKRDEIQNELINNENDIDNEAKMIYLNMTKIEQNNTEGKDTFNSKMIIQGQENIEGMILKKKELNKNLTRIDAAEIGVDILKNNPLQQN